jgi:hypothetical protein
MMSLPLSTVALPSTLPSPRLAAAIPMNVGALFIYALVGVSTAAVVYFGTKKPKGPGSSGQP